MESRQFVWNLSKLVIVAKHLADQKRHNCAFSGQSREQAYESDIAYYSSCDEFASATVTRRQLHGKDGLYDRIYGHAAALRSQLCEVGKDRTEVQMSLKTMGISASSLSRCSSSELSTSRQEIFDCLISIAIEQERRPENSADMTQNELTIHRSKVENERRKKAKEATIVRKLEKTTKDNDKYALGYAVLENSDGGNKRKRSSYEDDNTEDDSDNGAMSATYRIENKIPVVCPSDVTSSSKSSKRRASPPKQSRILSLQEVKAMYPNLALHDEEDDDQDIIAPIKRKETKAVAQTKAPANRVAGSRASSSNCVVGVLSDMRSDLISMMTPTIKAQGSVIPESPAPMSILTQALNAFDVYASSLSVSSALKFKKSLSLPNAAEMFLQYNDAERQEQIQEVLEN